MPPVPPATGPYANAWLGGSPFGQVDICQIGRLTTIDDLLKYKGLAYAGWNSMNTEITAVLSQYVQQGGRLLICLPHLSTRLDRECRRYDVDDLIGNGNLSALVPVTVKGSKSLATQPTFADKNLTAPAPSVLATLKDERVADVAVGPDAEVLCGTPDAPVVVRFRQGRGEIILLLTWEYPGKPSIAGLYQHLLAEFASSLHGEVYVTETGEAEPRSGPNTAFIAYATYPDRTYLLNMDTQSPHSFWLHRGTQTSLLTLRPAELREAQSPARN